MIRDHNSLNSLCYETENQIIFLTSILTTVSEAAGYGNEINKKIIQT